VSDAYTEINDPDKQTYVWQCYDTGDSIPLYDILPPSHNIRCYYNLYRLIGCNNTLYYGTEGVLSNMAYSILSESFKLFISKVGSTGRLKIS
jgi:hypothetical protein